MTARGYTGRPSFLRRLTIAVVVIGLSSLVGFAIVEGGLRLLRDPNRFYPYHRNSLKIFYPSEAITPGVAGVSRFTTNDFGTRGPAPHGEPVQILTVGGSTTACTVLDDSEAWPQLLMEYLNESAGDSGAYWVTNSGIDGKNSHHHLMHAMYLLPQMRDLDYAIYYVGINDVGMWLYAESFDRDFLEDPLRWNQRIAEAFRLSNHTPTEWPLYKRLELWKRASVLKDKVLSRWNARERERGGIVQDAELRWIAEERKKRQARLTELVPRAKMDTLPIALDHYEHVLGRIARQTREAGVEPIFMAQAMQSQFLDESERNLLWLGAMDGGEKYLREEKMLQLVTSYNERLREVAAREGVHFVDLPELLSGDRDLFFDGLHFNEHGARRVARVLTDSLLASALQDDGL